MSRVSVLFQSACVGCQRLWVGSADGPIRVWDCGESSSSSSSSSSSRSSSSSSSSQAGGSLLAVMLRHVGPVYYWVCCEVCVLCMHAADSFNSKNSLVSTFCLPFLPCPFFFLPQVLILITLITLIRSRSCLRPGRMCCRYSICSLCHEPLTRSSSTLITLIQTCLVSLLYLVRVIRGY